MTIVTVGIDLAKNVFAAHGVNEAGIPSLVRPQVPRAKLLEIIAHLPPWPGGRWPESVPSMEARTKPLRGASPMPLPTM